MGEYFGLSVGEVDIFVRNLGGEMMLGRDDIDVVFRKMGYKYGVVGNEGDEVFWIFVDGKKVYLDELDVLILLVLLLFLKFMLSVNNYNYVVFLW